MTYKEVYEMIGSVGYPAAYRSFDTEQSCPFICYYYSNSNDIVADNSNYQKIDHLIIELYTDTKDFDAEAEMETALAAYEMVWTKDETDVPSERMYEVIYEMDVVITGKE